MSLPTMFLISLATLFTFTHSVHAQGPEKFIYHQGKYRLILPEEWMKPKMIRTVTAILAKTIDELKGRDFCTDGGAAYYVVLIFDSLTIQQNNFSFQAALRTFDSTGKPVADLKLVSLKEVFEAKRTVIRNTTTYSVPGKDYDIYDDNGNVIGRIPTYTTPLEIENNAGLTLLDMNIVSICKRKISDIYKILKKINAE